MSDLETVYKLWDQFCAVTKSTEEGDRALWLWDEHIRRVFGVDVDLVWSESSCVVGGTIVFAAPRGVIPTILYRRLHPTPSDPLALRTHPLSNRP